MATVAYEEPVDEGAAQVKKTDTIHASGLVVAANAERVAVNQGMAASLVAEQNAEVNDSFVLSSNAGQTTQVTDSYVAFSVTGQDLSFNESGAMLLVAGNDLHLTNGGAGFITAGRDMSVTNGGAGFLIAKGDLTVQNKEPQSSLLLAGQDVRVETGSIGVVFAINADVEDDANVLIELSPRKAVEAVVKIAALPLAGAMLLSRWLRSGLDTAD